MVIIHYGYTSHVACSFIHLTCIMYVNKGKTSISGALWEYIIIMIAQRIMGFLRM